ncbi:MAG: hypothetical protein RIE31_08755 [Alphaproteobacteria bacterium]
MANLIAYEIQIYTSGAWKIDSVFDDRELAVAEAQRLERSRRYPAVRVMEEQFSDAEQVSRTRTVYRGSGVDRSNRRAVQRQVKNKQEIEAEKAQVDANRDARTNPPPRRKSATTITVWAMLKFALIATAGIAAVIAIRWFSFSG